MKKALQITVCACVSVIGIAAVVFGLLKPGKKALRKGKTDNEENT